MDLVTRHPCQAKGNCLRKAENMKLFRLSTLVSHLCVDIAYLLLRLRQRYPARNKAAETCSESGMVGGPGLLGEIPGTAHTA